MATPEDVNANAEYVRMADQCITVPGGTNNYNYANVELIVDIAERTRVDVSGHVPLPLETGSSVP